jgi:hypothetical protein
MDPGTPEQSNIERTAHRARTIIILVMAVLIFAPFVAYILAGRGAPPR